MSSYEELIKLKKPELIGIAKELGLKNVINKQKEEIIKRILEVEIVDKYTPIPINEIIYNKIYHISDIHIRPLKRHNEYNEVFNNLYSFLEKDISGNNIIAITGDIFHEKDLLKPETIVICRNFIKKCSTYGTVIIITGNHDMLENNPDRLDNLTAVFDDLPIHYLVDSGSYIFGNIIVVVSSLVDKKFIKKTQVINIKNKPVVALYHGTINGSMNDTGYIIEDHNQHSTRFRKISDFDGYDMVLLGDIHKHQYLKPHIAYPGSLIQQNFGENLKEHGVLVWDILTKKSNFYPIQNNYGFITIQVVNNEWKIPNNIPKKPFIRLLLKDTNNDISESIKNNLEQNYELQSFKIIQLTEKIREEVPNEVSIHQGDIDIMIEEMNINNINEEKKASILDIHNKLKVNCVKEADIEYNMNNQSWKLLKLSFRNVFIFGENKLNIIDFTKLNGITLIHGPNAIGKSNIINIIIFLLYGNTNQFKVPHILNKYQNEYFIEGELMFGSQLFKIKKTGKKRKGDKLNHSFSFYIYEDKWIQQDTENNKGTTQLIRSFLGTVDDFLLTNVYSNSSLRTILTLTNSEKHKAFNKLFCLDIYENLEKLAKNDISDIKKQCLFLEGELKGLLYHFDDSTIKKIENNINIIKLSLEKENKEMENIKEKITFIREEKIKIEIKKNKCIIEPIEFIEYNIEDIQNKINEYKSNYSNILIKENEDIEELKLTYYTLKGSLKDNECIFINDELEKELEKELKYKLSIFKEDQEIIIQEENKEKYQKIINSLYKQIIYLTDIQYDYEECTEYSDIINIELLEKELINIQSKIKNISGKLIELSIDYNDSVNTINIQNIDNKIYLYTELSEDIKNTIYVSINNIGISINNIDISITNETRKIEFGIKNNSLKEKIKQLHTVKNIDIKEIDIKQNNLLNVENLQRYIDMLDSNITEENKLEIKNFLFNIKENIENFTFLSENNKLNKLLKNKKLLDENSEIEKNNFNIKEKIKELEYNYYNECYSYNYYLISSLQEEREKYINNQYTYQYHLKNKYSSIEKRIKYEKIKKYKEQKNQNDKLIKECSDNEKKVENIKDIIKNSYQTINNLKNKLESTRKKIKSIEIYKYNNEINNKLNIIKKCMEDQTIRNEYNHFIVILNKEDTYNTIKKNNEKMRKNITIYSDMLCNINNEISDLTNLLCNIQSNIYSIIKEQSICNDKLKELKNIKDKENNLNNQLNELKKDIVLYSEYIHLINTVPKKLILKKISYLQEHINLFLRKLTNFTIEITIKNGIEFIAHKNNMTLDVNQLSGYETFILNIGLKSALNKYSFLSKSTLFIIDEGLDVVDKENVKKLKILTNYLLNNYKHILLISHMDHIKYLEDSNISIQNNGVSSHFV